MTINKCQQSFDRGSASRLSNPLQRGLYKLREHKLTLDRVHQTVEAIAAREANPSSYHANTSLGCCMPFEKGQWLKDELESVCYLLGYHFVPSVRALGADGVPENVVRQAARRAEAQARDLIRQFEALRRHVKTHGIAVEYKAMKADRSEFLRLFRELEVQVGDMLALAEHYARRGEFKTTPFI